MGLAIGLRGSSELLVDVLVVGALVSGAGTVTSLLPIRYALGSGGGRRGKQRPGRMADPHQRYTPHSRDDARCRDSWAPAIRTAYAVVLLAITAVAFFLSVSLGLILVLLFFVAWWVQAADVRAGR